MCPCAAWTTRPNETKRRTRPVVEPATPPSSFLVVVVVVVVAVISLNALKLFFSVVYYSYSTIYLCVSFFGRIGGRFFSLKCCHSSGVSFFPGEKEKNKGGFKVSREEGKKDSGKKKGIETHNNRKRQRSSLLGVSCPCALWRRRKRRRGG